MVNTYTMLQTLTQDLQMQVLQRVPLNSLMTLMRVSSTDFWAPIILSEDFRRAYLSRSMTRPPRVLFVVQHSASERSFHSVDPLCPSGQQEVRTQKSPAVDMMVCQLIRGLLCIKGGSDIVICNPGAKEVRILEPPEADVMSCFFGYDQSKDVFKVLAVGIGSKQIFTVGSDYKKQPQILAVGSDQKQPQTDHDHQSWREIACTHAHVPIITEGIFIEGVLYYGALGLSGCMIMSFNMTSEDFNAIQWPEDVTEYQQHVSTLANYFGKLAIVTKALDGKTYDLNADGIFELWVWEGTWSKTRIEIQGWKKATGPDDDQLFCFLGTIGETTLVFETSPLLPGQPDHSLIYYDTATETLRRCQVDIDVYMKEHQTFLNHVESTWLM